ncbi:MAG TPA: Ger(x)C family spore germination protein [Ruminiclostridium sp.]|nr:Ger(x)C family spore germination protein [Ruminiclostridium sp.]
MKIIKIFLLVLMVLVNTIFLTGCWSYAEIDKLAIVAGVAFDKGINDKYMVTVEIVQNSGGKDSKTSSEIISMEGKTLFDAVRNGIALTGKRLYWAHSSVVILSKDIAQEGITKITDWYIRDSETREDVDILISEEASAKEILEGQETTDPIKSLTMAAVVKNQRSLSKSPKSDVLSVSMELQSKGMSTVIPTVNLKQIDGKTVPQIIGTAIIKDDKLIGELNGEETKDLIFIRDEVKGGILVEGTEERSLTTPVSLEIFKSKTKVKPDVEGRNIKMEISINTTVSIDEIEGNENYIDDAGRKKLEQNANSKMKERIQSLIKKVQSEYDADIFKFGTKLREDNVQTWEAVCDKWEKYFKILMVDVKPNVHIKNSAILAKTLGKGG